MKIAITGASGYLGGCIADAFRESGHDVVSFSRRPCAAPWFSFALGDDPANLPWNGVDLLIHAAYDFTARTWEDNLATNVKPSIDLFHSAASAKVGKLVFVSSMSSFDGCRSDYGKAKRMIEKEVLALGATVVRPGLVWGNGAGGVMGVLQKVVSLLPVVPYPGGGKWARQFLVHQADLSAALLAIAKEPPPLHPEVRSLAHPEPLPLLAVLKICAEKIRRSRIFLPIPWPCVLAGLRIFESTGVRTWFRSDSLLGLIHGNPAPEISEPPSGVVFRAFK